MLPFIITKLLLPRYMYVHHFATQKWPHLWKWCTYLAMVVLRSPDVVILFCPTHDQQFVAKSWKTNLNPGNPSHITKSIRNTQRKIANICLLTHTLTADKNINIIHTGMNSLQCVLKCAMLLFKLLFQSNLFWQYSHWYGFSLNRVSWDKGH